MTRSFRDYNAYGLHVRSQLDLPFAPPLGSPSGEADVTVSFGKTLAAIPNPIEKRRLKPAWRGTWEAVEDAFLMNVPGIAAYYVTGGRNIVIDPRCDDDRKISVFLVGRVFGTLLLQRDLIVSHVSAIATEAGAVLFMGSSGSGKSSLLAALLNRDYLMLSDDMTGITLDAAERLTVLPSFPYMRLRADTLDMTGWRERAQTWAREGTEKTMLKVERFHPTPQPLRAVAILTCNDRQKVGIERLPITHVFRWLRKHIRYKRMLGALGKSLICFRTLTAISKNVPVSLVERPAHPFMLDMLADRIDADLRGEPLPHGNDAAAGQTVSRSVAGS